MILSPPLNWFTPLRLALGPTWYCQMSIVLFLSLPTKENETMTIFLSTPKEGSVSLIKGPFLDANTPPTVSTITFPWTDDKLLAKWIHLPLSASSLEYWDESSSIAGDVDFTTARAAYTAASGSNLNICPCYGDGKYVLVSLQKNSALIKIDVASEVAEDIYR